jgi:hypothetical protein
MLVVISVAPRTMENAATVAKKFFFMGTLRSFGCKYHISSPVKVYGH